MDLSIRAAERSFKQSSWIAVRAALAWPGRVSAARRAMLQLAQMSVSELKDIGLVPQDLNDAMAFSLDADPTKVLAQRVRERRLSR